MAQEQYKQVYPTEQRDVYVEYNPVNLNIVIPDGMEFVADSADLVYDKRYTINGNYVGEAQNIYFDNYAGSACDIDKPSLKMGSLFADTNFDYYTEYCCRRNQLLYSPDELSNQSSHTLEHRCCDAVQTREYLRTNDGWSPNVHHLQLGINRTNRNYDGNDLGGSIEFKYLLKDRSKAFYGADINLANSVAQYRNIRLVYKVRPKSQSGLLTMGLTNSKRTEIKTGNAHFDYICPIPTSSVTSYFSTRALVDTATSNSCGSVKPVISELVYQFNNSNMEKLTYTLNNDEEILANYAYSLLGDGINTVNCMTGARLNHPTQSTYGIGINFDGYQPKGSKISVQLISDTTNAAPRLLYTFYNGMIVLKDGDKPQKINDNMIMSIPLNFGSNKDDSFQTIELNTKYHNPNTRTEFHMPAGYTIDSDIRVVGLNATNNNGIYQYATGTGALLKNCHIYANGKIMISGINQGMVKTMYGFNKLKSSNRKNRFMRSAMDGSFWGFKNTHNVANAGPGYAVSANLWDGVDGLNKFPKKGSYDGYLRLKDIIPALDQVEYLRFTEWKIVFEWQTDGTKIFTPPGAGGAQAQPAIQAPTLLFDRFLPDRPLSEFQFWDLEMDSLVIPAIVAPAPVANTPVTTDAEIQGFNGKTLGNMLIVNAVNQNPLLGDFQSHAQAVGETYRFTDDSKDLPVFEGDMKTVDLQKLLNDSFGSLNVPMLTDRWALQNGAGGQPGDNLYDGNIQQFLHTMCWRALPFKGYKAKKMALKYTRLSTGNPQDVITMRFICQVLKKVTFDSQGKAVVTYV